MSDVPVTPAPAAAARPQPALDPDWAAKATDKVVETVDLVASKTTDPARKVARGIVYGLVAAVLGTMALIILLVALVRFMDVFIPGDVWIVHTILGTLCSVIGFWLWRKR